jgi:23S rRNA pseudouridine2457 synthase
MEQHRYFLVNKPVNMVSQFVSSHDVRLLGSLPFDFPEGTHAIGRLDKDSEGLLLLTTNKKVTRLLFHGEKPHARTYLVMAKNKVSEETVSKLAKGISISAPNSGRFITTPCEVKLTGKPDYIKDLDTEIHQNVVNSWLTLTLTEGRFHQVRKMMAAVKHKCIRLIRISIEDIHVQDIPPGGVKEVSEAYFFEKLKL